MKMLNSFEQGDSEWKQARAGKVTASRAKDARDRLKSGAASGKQIAYACQVALERVALRLQRSPVGWRQALDVRAECCPSLHCGIARGG